MYVLNGNQYYIFLYISFIKISQFICAINDKDNIL